MKDGQQNGRDGPRLAASIASLSVNSNTEETITRGTNNYINSSKTAFRSMTDIEPLKSKLEAVTTSGNKLFRSASTLRLQQYIQKIVSRDEVTSARRRHHASSKTQSLRDSGSIQSLPKSRKGSESTGEQTRHTMEGDRVIGHTSHVGGANETSSNNSQQPQNDASLDTIQRLLETSSQLPTAATVFTHSELDHFPRSYHDTILRVSRRGAMKNMIKRITRKGKGRERNESGVRPQADLRDDLSMSSADKDLALKMLEHKLHHIVPRQFDLGHTQTASQLESQKMALFRGDDDERSIHPQDDAIQKVIKRMIYDIKRQTWLSEDDRVAFAEIFSAELFRRYNQMDIKIIIPTELSASNNRQLILKVFERVNALKNGVLEKCRRRVQHLKKSLVFDEETNSDRVRTMFRTELGRVIDSTRVVNEVIDSIIRGETDAKPVEPTDAELLSFDIDELRALQVASEKYRKTLAKPDVKVVQDITAKLRQEKLDEEALERAEEKDQVEVDYAKTNARQQRRTSLTPLGMDFSGQNQRRQRRGSTSSSPRSTTPSRRRGSLSPRVSSPPPQHRRRGSLSPRVTTPTRSSNRAKSPHRVGSADGGKDSKLAALEAEEENALYEEDDTDILLRELGDSSSNDSADDADVDKTLADFKDTIADPKKVLGAVPVASTNPMLTAYTDGVQQIYKRKLDRIPDNESSLSTSTSLSRYPSNAGFKLGPRERYLIPSEQRKKHMPDIDFNKLDDLSLKSKAKGKPQPYFETFFPDNSVVRTAESTFSIRTPKGGIHVSPASLAVVTEFGDVDAKTLQTLDENLMRYKEVEELYEEIMKTIVGNHLQYDDNFSKNNCPAAPIDETGQLSLAFEGTRIPHSRRNAHKPKEKAEKKHHEIRMLTRAEHTLSVTPEEFLRGRRRAMQRVQSSRYAFRYNFGGYIPPFQKKETRSTKRKGGAGRTNNSSRTATQQLTQKFNVQNYMDFLRAKKNDFLDSIFHLENPEEEAEERLQEELRVAEEARLKFEEEQRKKREEKERLLQYQPGRWNANILDYIGELTEKGKSSVGLDDSEMILPAISENADKNARALYEKYQEKQRRRHSLKTVTTEDAQKRISAVWEALQLPPQQQMEMAAKYGSHRFSEKVVHAIELWERAADLILQREVLLIELQEVEKKASDPERFFKKGPAGSSKWRLREAADREKIGISLKQMDVNVEAAIQAVRADTEEIVTYKGQPYLDKMISDHSNMLYFLQTRRIENLVKKSGRLAGTAEASEENDDEPDDQPDQPESDENHDNEDTDDWSDVN